MLLALFVFKRRFDLSNKLLSLVVMIDCPDYFVDELSDIFVRNDAVLDADESILRDLYNIPEKELKNMHISDVLIDKTTKLIVDQ